MNSKLNGRTTTMLRKTLTAAATLATIAGFALPAMAQDYTIRAVANSNENDEDYDGLQVFKSYVESASNGAIARPHVPTAAETAAAATLRAIFSWPSPLARAVFSRSFCWSTRWECS